MYVGAFLTLKVFSVVRYQQKEQKMWSSPLKSHQA